MRILVTAGPTREPLDPVRFLSNRSSGRMGYAVARSAVRRGHRVVLVSGPVSLRPPRGARTIRVVTAAEMRRAVARWAAWCDALIMAAAVSDWRPRRTARTKMKKARGVRVLPLVRTPDILAGLRRRKGRRVFVGFAAETGNPEKEARRKRKSKGLDLVVGNDVSRSDAGFEVKTNRVCFVAGGAPVQRLPLLSKDRVARRIVRWVEQRLAAAGRRNI